MSQSATVRAIRFEAIPSTIDNSMILRLPEDASALLPSRGQVAIEGTINDQRFRTVLEPDGNRGHWLRVDEQLRRSAGIRPGTTVAVEVHPTKDWPEPSVPEDLEAALSAAPGKIKDVWKDITPMARWEWVRWVNATGNPDTRSRRVEVSISKMNSGKRRPCCFDLASCTDPELARNARLRDPA